MVAVNSMDRTRQSLFDILISLLCHCEALLPNNLPDTDTSRQKARSALADDCFVGKNALLSNDMSESYKFSSLSVSTMLSLRIIAPETIMVAKTIARMPSTQAAIAHQGRLKAK